LAFAGGVIHLNADPPAISWSQDVATDPPQYTNFARNKVLWDSWVVYPPNRLVFFLKSFSSVASYVVFSIFGTGRSQANLVAVLLNLLTMLFLFLALRKVFGKRAAFFSFFLLAINYVFIMYGRNLFLEISALFLLTLGFYFAISGFKKQALLIPSGICFAAAIFFGKTMAAFILPACLIVLLLWMFQYYSASERRIDIRPPIFLAAGFLSVVIFWLFFSYLPAQREVAGYLGEQALGLYGFPLALKSISGFISSLFTFGTDLFYRMPVAFLLSFLGLLLFFRNRPSFGELIRHRDDRSKAAAFIVIWFLAAFFVLMILNYRPLRYQIYLIPPLAALAGLWLDRLVSPERARKASSGVLFWVVFLVAVTFVVNYVITTLYTLSRKQVSLGSSLPIALVVTIICGALYFWRLSALRKASREAAGPSPAGLKLLLALFLILVAFVVNGWQYVSWASSPTYSLNRSSLDLGKLLSPEAVISGPYGPALVWDNRLRDLIHMFGVTQPDPRLFMTYPITHLALERGGNRDRAFKDYPEVMNQSPVVATYWLRNIPVDIYRIAEHTGNSRAEAYPLSDFEKAKLLLDQGNDDSALVMLEQFVSRNPDNYSGYVALAEMYFNLNDFEKSSQALERAIAFNPTDFLTRQQLGTVYLNLGQQTKQDSYRLLAIDQWERSLKLFPQNTKLAARLQSIKGY
jgi:tetratricopeptide (TPR) repeat protein